MTETRTARKILVAIFAVLLVYSGSIWQRPLYSPAETGFAETAREMLAVGDYTVPYLNGVIDCRKAAPEYWMTAGSMKLFGENPFAVRLPSVVFTILTAAAVYWICARTGSRKSGIISALLFLTGGMVFCCGTFASPEPVFSFFTASAAAAGFLSCQEQNRGKQLVMLLVSGLFLGCAFLLKGWCAPILFAISLAGFMLLQKKYRRLLISIAPVLAGMAAVALPGVLYLHRAAPEFWSFSRLPEYFSGILHAKSIQSFFTVPAALAAGSFPALLFLPATIVFFRKKRRDFLPGDSLFSFALFTAVCWTLFLMFFGKAGFLSALPVFPFLAILPGRLLAAGAEDPQCIRITGRTFQVFCTVTGCALAAFLLWHCLPVKFKLYHGPGMVSPVMVSGLLLLWFGMAAKEKDTFPERKFLYYCIGCAVIMLSLNPLIPFRFSRHFEQTTFIRRAVKPKLRPGALVFADGSMAGAVSWTLKTPVPVFADPGDLQTGLARAGIRPLTPEELKILIPEAIKRKQQIAVILSRKNRLREMPAGRTIVHSGRMAAVFYGDFDQ